MERIVMAVFDVQAQAFSAPVFVASRGVGVRMVSDEVNRSAPDNLLFSHSGDFRFFQLGVFDDLTGSFRLEPQPVLVCECSSLKVV